MKRMFNYGLYRAMGHWPLDKRIYRPISVSYCELTQCKRKCANHDDNCNEDSNLWLYGPLLVLLYSGQWTPLDGFFRLSISDVNWGGSGGFVSYETDCRFQFFVWHNSSRNTHWYLLTKKVYSFKMDVHMKCDRSSLSNITLFTLRLLPIWVATADVDLHCDLADISYRKRSSLSELGIVSEDMVPWPGFERASHPWNIRDIWQPICIQGYTTGRRRFKYHQTP